MTAETFQQIHQEFHTIQNSEEREAFDKKHLERIISQTDEENEAELAFLEQEFLAIKAFVAQARKNVTV